ncbi:MAG: VanZ family protein [Lachnospiraceae bacterium]|nr:VanZ family protein [Lachnospiraceae bacterium]
MQKGNPWKVWMKFFFAVYILFVIKVIIFKYPIEQLRAIADTWQRSVILEGLGTANFTPFKTIKMYIVYAHKLNSVENLAGNILVFVPLGFLLPFVADEVRSFPAVMLNAFVFVLGIEMFQLFSAFGAFDVDDIMLNCLGAALGYGCYKAVYPLWCRQRAGALAGEMECIVERSAKVSGVNEVR